jgi:hypothetical protein
LPYLAGNIWILAVLITTIVSILLFITDLDKRGAASVEANMGGTNRFKAGTVTSNSYVMKIFFVDLVILMLLLVIGIRIKKGIMTQMYEQVLSTSMVNLNNNSVIRGPVSGNNRQIESELNGSRLNLLEVS